MRDPADQVTAEIQGVEPGIKSVVTPRKAPWNKKYASDAEKQAAYRARKGVTVISVMLPNDVHAAFVAKAAAQGKGQSEIITKLVKSQYLRER